MELFSAARRGQRRRDLRTVYRSSRLTSTDVAELERLLRAVFKDDVGAANRWLSSYSKYFRAKPIELIKRDVVGVVRLISYLKDLRQLRRDESTLALDQRRPSAEAGCDGPQAVTASASQPRDRSQAPARAPAPGSGSMLPGA